MICIFIAVFKFGAEGSTSVVGATGRKVMVSFVKCRRIASIISDIQMYQNEPYALEVEPSVRVSDFMEFINPMMNFVSCIGFILMSSTDATFCFLSSI